MSDKLPLGCPVLDEFLEGGIERDVITTVFGPAGAGKTTVCLLAAAKTSFDKKVIYVDTEGSFSVERLKQIVGPKDSEHVLSRIFILKPTTFSQQQSMIDKLRDMVDDKIGLVIVDTIAMLYRAEMGASEDYQGVNRTLAKQMAALIRIARDKGVPVLITNQVYADFENKDAVHVVGGDVTKYSSKCLIELQILNGNKRKAILRKHRHIPHKEQVFAIVEKGFEKAAADAPQGKGFKLF